MRKKTALEEITDLSGDLPINVLIDINKRIADWLLSGGGENDTYIHQQLKYAKNILELRSRGG